MPACPVATLLAYIAVWGAAEGPFFQFANGQLATKQAEICFHISSSSPSDRPPITRLAGDSFCIGAATAKAGIEDSVICTLGRWNSTAFLSYICTPSACFSSRLSHYCNMCNICCLSVCIASYVNAFVVFLKKVSLKSTTTGIWC